MIRTAFLTAVFAALLPAQDQAAPDFKRTEDVVYGRKFGTALTMDVIQPSKPNGRGMIWVVSGGWVANHDAIRPAFFKEFLARGYTVFAVVPSSQPRFEIAEINQDMHRSVRFIRANASRFGIDPKRIGVAGGSAGCHLSLLVGTQGRQGDEKAKDPIDRENSAVQAVACFFPPTDFLNYGRPGEDAVGVGILKAYRPAFGPRAETPEGRQALGKEISPIYFVSSAMPPTLLIHGDADKLVPIQQSQTFIARAKEFNAVGKLIVREGKSHGWPNLGDDLVLIADWFDQYLRGNQPQ